jgi:tetratricopeptide (TPR) repeat protein
LLETGQIDDAFEAYELACRHNRTHTASYYNRLGNSLMRNKIFDRAIDAFEIALAFDASAPCRHNLTAAYKAAGKIPPAPEN